MWQRIQTVFLALVAICMIVCLFLPIAIFEDPVTGDSHQLYPIHYTVISQGKETISYFPYMICAILMCTAGTLAVISIGKYENRITQIKLGTLNSLILAFAMGAQVLMFNPLVTRFQNGKMGITLWILFAAVTFNWLSLRFIRRDEKLVRNADRLR